MTNRRYGFNVWGCVFLLIGFWGLACFAGCIYVICKHGPAYLAALDAGEPWAMWSTAAVLLAIISTQFYHILRKGARRN